jgi:hypothetical protein
MNRAELLVQADAAIERAEAAFQKAAVAHVRAHCEGRRDRLERALEELWRVDALKQLKDRILGDRDGHQAAVHSIGLVGLERCRPSGVSSYLDWRRGVFQKTRGGDDG